MLHNPILRPVYCILDGLDECEEDSLKVLLKRFRTLFREAPELTNLRFNLIVVSREFPDFIPEILSGFPRIRLDPDVQTQLSDDIDLFIEGKVDELAERKHYPDPLRAHVKRVFRERAEGTFLWVGIVAAVLDDRKVSEAEETLDLFPSGLDGMYARILLQIDGRRQKIAAKILRWVVMAVRPLKLLELSAMLETSAASFTADPLDRIDLSKAQVSYCGHFLVVQENREVNLVHQSAKDYLLRRTSDPSPKLEAFRVEEQLTNLEIAKRCFYYLQEGPLTDIFADDRIPPPKALRQVFSKQAKSFPLLEYALRNWPHHAKLLDRSECIFDLSLAIYQPTSMVRRRWMRLYYWAVMDPQIFFLWKYPDSWTLLQIASILNLLPLAENILLLPRRFSIFNWVKRSSLLNALNCDAETALYWAARLGHEAIVRFLLKKGANFKLAFGEKTNSFPRYGRTALDVAVSGKQWGVVQILLNESSTVDQRKRVLYEAALGGHDTLICLILDRNSNSKVRNPMPTLALCVALQLAARNSKASTIRLLLAKGANTSPLSRDELIECFNIQREKGFRDERGDIAMLAAVWYGDEASARLFIEAGAEIHFRSFTPFGVRTPLLLAAEFGVVPLLRTLLENGADAGLLDNHGNSVLHLAALGEWHVVTRVSKPAYEDVVRLLLHHATTTGLKYKKLNDEGKTALHYAHSEAIEQLLKPHYLESGSDDSSHDGNGSRELIFACEV